MKPLIKWQKSKFNLFVFISCVFPSWERCNKASKKSNCPLWGSHHLWGSYHQSGGHQLWAVIISGGSHHLWGSHYLWGSHHLWGSYHQSGGHQLWAVIISGGSHHLWGGHYLWGSHDLWSSHHRGKFIIFRAVITWFPHQKSNLSPLLTPKKELHMSLTLSLPRSQ